MDFVELNAAAPPTGGPWTPGGLSAAAGGPTTPFASLQKLSTTCSLFADGRRLVVVSHHGVDPLDTDRALAWGLAHRGGRELTLVLPTAAAKPSRLRIPWLVPPVRLFTYDHNGVNEPAPLTQAESLEEFARRVWEIDRPAVLEAKADWIHAVLDWTKVAPRLDRVERPKYVAWHVAGRQVLKVEPTAKRLRVTAGVKSSKPETWPPVVELSLVGPATDAELHAITAAVANAAARRLEGVDDGHHEHQLQSALSPSALGLTPGWLREFPAWRPSSHHVAYLDFLARDPAGRLHVVETKIGPDTLLVLQGLDYWLWCRANADHAAAAVGATNRGHPIIDFVVAPKTPGQPSLSPYTPAQAQALHPDIEWRFTIVDDWKTAQPVHQLPPRQLPG